MQNILNISLRLLFLTVFTLLITNTTFVSDTWAGKMNKYGDMLEDDMLNPFEGDAEAGLLALIYRARHSLPIRRGCDNPAA